MHSGFILNDLGGEAQMTWGNLVGFEKWENHNSDMTISGKYMVKLLYFCDCWNVSAIFFWKIVQQSEVKHAKTFLFGHRNQDYVVDV